MKKTPRVYNRKLKKEYQKGFQAGYQAHKEQIKEPLIELSNTIKNSLGKYVSEQLIDAVMFGMLEEVTIEISGRDLLDIVRNAIWEVE